MIYLDAMEQPTSRGEHKIETSTWKC